MTPEASPSPSPAEAVSLDDLITVLGELRDWGGRPSFAEIARRVGMVRRGRNDNDRPGRTTIYDCFRTGRRRLDEQLILDIVRALGVTGGDLDIWQRTLHGLRPVDAASTHRGLSHTLSVPAPRMSLIGRDEQLSTLLRLSPGSLALVTGMSGIGKSELVLHAAATWLSRLPAGTPGVFVDVRGFDPHRPPLTPTQVLTGLLTQLGKEHAQVATLNRVQQQEILRRVLTDKPGIVVVDNVPSLELLQAVIPTRTRSRFVVTSRRSLLNSTDAHPSFLSDDEHHADAAAEASVPDLPPIMTVPLGPLRAEDARQLLESSLTDDCPPSEAQALHELIRLTGGLPLDVVLAAASVASHPDWSIADHVHRYASVPRDEHVRPALQLAYRGLDAYAQRTFRALGCTRGRGWMSVALHRS